MSQANAHHGSCGGNSRQHHDDRLQSYGIACHAQERFGHSADGYCHAIGQP